MRARLGRVDASISVSRNILEVSSLGSPGLGPFLGSGLGYNSPVFRALSVLECVPSGCGSTQRPRLELGMHVGPLRAAGRRGAFSPRRVADRPCGRDRGPGSTPELAGQAKLFGFGQVMAHELRPRVHPQRKGCQDRLRGSEVMPARIARSASSS